LTGARWVWACRIAVPIAVTLEVPRVATVKGTIEGESVMRKFSNVVLGLLFVIIVAGAANAQVVSLAPSTQIKVGVVDVARVFDESDAGIAANNQLNQFIAELQADLDALEAQINALERELQQAGDELAEADREARQAQIDQLIEEYFSRFDTYEAHIQELSQSLQQALLDEIFQVIRFFAEQYGYDVILEANATLYYRLGVDVTSDVIRTYNELRRQSLESVDEAAPVTDETE